MSTFLVIQPTRGTLFTAVQEAIEQEFRTHKQYPAIMRTNGLKLIEARKRLVDMALSTEADIIIFLDDDVLLPKGAFQAFEDTLKDAAVAVIDYPHHYHPLLSEIKPTGVTVFTQWLPGDDTTYKEVAWSGLGATAMRRNTLKRLNEEIKPLFRNTAHPVSVDSLGRMGLQPTNDKGLGGQRDSYSGGEDTNFFLAARGTGLKIKMVPDLKAEHLRLDYAVSWVAEDKYNSVHKIESSTEIEQAGNALHMDLSEEK